MKRSPPSRRRVACQRQSISLGTFALYADGEDSLMLFPLPIARALGMRPGQQLQIDLVDGEIRVILARPARLRSLLRASYGWPSIRRALRFATARWS